MERAAAPSGALALTDPPPAIPPTPADCWSHPLPIHLARLDGDAAEPHILRGMD